MFVAGEYYKTQRDQFEFECIHVCTTRTSSNSKYTSFVFSFFTLDTQRIYGALVKVTITFPILCVLSDKMLCNVVVCVVRQKAMQCFCVCYQTKGYAIFLCVLSDKRLCNVCVCVIRQRAMQYLCVCYQTNGYAIFLFVIRQKAIQIICFVVRQKAMHFYFLLSDKRLYNVLFAIRQKAMQYFFVIRQKGYTMLSVCVIRQKPMQWCCFCYQTEGYTMSFFVLSGKRLECGFATYVLLGTICAVRVLFCTISVVRV